MTVTTNLQAFGLIVTAEPYFAVTMPSDLVVMQNIVVDKTQGVIEQVNAHYTLLPRGAYAETAGRTQCCIRSRATSARLWNCTKPRMRCRSPMPQARNSTPPTRWRRPRLRLQNAEGLNTQQERSQADHHYAREKRCSRPKTRASSRSARSRPKTKRRS